MILAKLGYNYTKHTSLDLAEVKAQRLHNTEPGFADSELCIRSPLYSDYISISNDLTDGPLGIMTKFLWGDGVNGRADVFGLSAIGLMDLRIKT